MKPIPFHKLLLPFLVVALLACTPLGQATGQKRTIVVTYAALGSLVKELVGDQFTVLVPMPNGLDPHEWEPSAQDMAAINHADLVVCNGLGLEGGMEKSLTRAREAKVPFFTASDHIDVRLVRAGQGIPGSDADQAPGAQDPHLWLDPLAMKSVVQALAVDLRALYAVDLSGQATKLAEKLDALDAEIRARVSQIPAENRLLVTGHESLGYLADRYGFTLIGAIIPGLSTQSQVSAAGLAALKAVVAGQRVKVIFTELGTPPKVAEALAAELGIKAVEIGTHSLPPDGSYFTMLRDLASAIGEAL